MSDTVTPAAPAAAASNPVSDAARTLASARAEHRAAVSRPATPPAPVVDTPAAPVKDNDDDLAALIAEDRRIKARGKELDAREAALKENEDLIPVVRAVREHLAKGERLAAVQALLPGEDLTTDFFWEVAKAAEKKAEQGGEPVDIAAAVSAEIEKRQAADREAAENKTRGQQQAVADTMAAADEKTGAGFGRSVVEVMNLGKETPERIAEVTEAFVEFALAVDETYAANASHFPAMTDFKPPPSEIVRTAEKLRQANGKVPGPLEVLQAIEADLKARARRSLGIDQGPAARPAVAVTSDWRTDAGRPAPEEKAPDSLDERRNAHREALRKRPAGATG